MTKEHLVQLAQEPLQKLAHLSDVIDDQLLITKIKLITNDIFCFIMFLRYNFDMIQFKNW